MRILVLTPQDHFHAPIVLRELGLQVGREDKISVATTPKLGPKHSFLYRLSKLAKQSGYDYLISMSIAKICFVFLGLIEKFLFFKPINKRKFLSVKEVIKYFKFETTKVKNINSPDSISLISAFKPDIIIALFFNQIIPKKTLALPSLAAINLHPSYLPAYRGMSPCFWPLTNNESFTGVSIHYLSPALDKGSIITQEKIPITSKTTFFTLYRACAIKLIQLLPQAIEAVKNKDTGIAQDESRATYVSQITPQAVRHFRKNRHRFTWLC